jgi:hypothetical protein
MKKKRELERIWDFVCEGIESAMLITAYVGLTLLALLVLPFVLLGRAVEGNGKVYKCIRHNRNK